MIINHARWRDQQLNGFTSTTEDSVLEQEQVMLNFVKKFDIRWKWLGNDTNFKTICQRHILLDNNNAQGVIIFGTCLGILKTSELVNRLRKLTAGFDYAYVAINRYEVVYHDIELELPDSIAESIDTIMKYCDPMFTRLHNFTHVDGNHMIAAHPMDCYGLCK